MATSELSTGKTVFVLTVVLGCFAVLWPKIFYPMFFGSPQYLSNMEKAQGVPLAGGAGCCDVYFEKDIQTLKILTQLCEENVINPSPKLSQAALLNLCYRELQETCNIDLSPLYKMSARHEVDSSFKKFLSIVRSYNSSLCLKDHYHVNLNLIGTPRLIKSTVMKPTSLINVKNDHGDFKPQMRQERPPHLRPEILHPALRENGRAIPHEHVVPRVEPDVTRPVVKTGIPKPGRPSFGGHQGSPKQGGGLMTLLMPMYTISIVAFFIYTMLRIWDPMVLFVKLVLQFISNSSNNARQNSTSRQDYYSETEFRSSYYNDSIPYSVAGTGRPSVEEKKAKPADSGAKLVVSAITGLLDQVNREILDSSNVEGSGSITAQPKDKVQADNLEAEPSPTSAEPKPSSAEASPDSQVTSDLFPSRQSSILEVEVHGYDDVKEVFDRTRHGATETNDKDKLVDKVADAIVEEEIVKKEIVPDQSSRPYVQSGDNDEESVDEDKVHENGETIVERARSVDETPAVKFSDQIVEKHADLEEELIKENIAKISEELNKTIIGEAVDYVLERRAETDNEQESPKINEAEKEFEDISDSSTLHEEQSGKPDVNRNETSSAEEVELDARAVQVINMERTESLVGGQKYAPPLPDAPPLSYPSRPITPEVAHAPQPHRIVLDGLLPESSQILVADELTETESVTTEDGESDTDSVVLSSKVTLSLIPAGREEHLDEDSGEDRLDASDLSKSAFLKLKEPIGESAKPKQDEYEPISDIESESEEEEVNGSRTNTPEQVKTNGRVEDISDEEEEIDYEEELVTDEEEEDVEIEEYEDEEVEYEEEIDDEEDKKEK